MDPTPLLLALGAAALACALGWRPWSAGGDAPPGTTRGPVTGPWASALVPTAVFLATWYGIERGWPAHPPKVATDHVVRALVLAVVPGWLLGRSGASGTAGARGSRLVGAGLLVAVVVGCTWPALAIYRERHWAEARGDLRVAGLAAAWAVGAVAFATGASPAGRPRRALEGLALLAVSAAAAVAAGFSSLTTALLVGGQAIALGGLWVAGLWRPTWPTLAAWRGPWAVAYGGLLGNAVLFGSLPAGAGALLGVAPLLPGAAGRLLPRRGSGALGILVEWTLLAVALGLAVWLAWPEPDPYDSLYGGLGGGLVGGRG